MVTGRVIRFDEVKGYGFIAPSDGGEDVFVHANEIIDRGLRVTPGSRVEFRMIEGDRGMKACDVRILEDPPPTSSIPARAANSLNSGNGYPMARQQENRSPADEELLEVFSEQEFLQQITDLLLATAPALTGAVIIELRASFLQFARKNGWVE